MISRSASPNPHAAQRAWRGAVEDPAARLGLSDAQAQRLAHKRLSRSDVRGMRAWIERRRREPFPGSRLLYAALEMRS